MFFYQISTLTAEVDTLETVGNATVKGIIGGGDKVETWGIVDTIAGGTAGSKMDLTAIVGDGTTPANVSTVGRSTSGIETFNITFKDANDKASNSLTVDTSSLAGAKNFNIVSATAAHDVNSNGDSVVFNGLAQDQMVTVKSADADLDVTLNYSDAAAAGKEDVASFSLHNAKVGNVTVGAGMEAVKVTATGDNEVALIDATSATKFVFDGAGKLDASLNGGNGKIAEIDASAMKGSLDLAVAAAHLNTTKAVIKGGTATDDVLGVMGDIDAKMTVSGFETVGLDRSAANPATFNMTNVAGATTVANFSDAALTVTKATGVTNLLMEGNGKADRVGDHVTIGGIDFAAAGATAQGALTVAINNDGVALDALTADPTKEAVINAGPLTINNVKDITINAADADVVLGGLAANKMESLTVTAAEDFTITDAVTFHKDATVNMAGVMGDVSMTMQGSGSGGAFTTALGYTGSLAADHLILSALTGVDTKGVAYTIDTGAGNDEVTLNGAVAASGSAKLTLNLGEGNDTLTLGASSVTIGAGQTIDFGVGGTDVLDLKGTTAVDLSGSTVSGLDKIIFNNTAALTINDATAETVTDVSGFAAGTLTVKMAGTDYNASGLKFGGTASNFAIIGSDGNDNIVGADYASTITGGKGNDTIALGTGKDTVVFSSATDNGVDTITGFTAGTTKDILDMSLVMTLTGIVGAGGLDISGTAALTDLSNHASSGVDLDGKMFTFTGTTTQLQTHIADSGSGAVNYLANGKSALAFVHAADSNEYTIYTVTGGTGATDVFTSIGTVGVTGAFTADNFDATTA